MSSLQRFRSRPMLIAGACGAVIVAASAADTARGATLDLISGPATSFTTVDLGTHGTTMGDVVLFESPILGGGQLLGAQTTIDVWRRSRTVQSALTFDLPAGQLAVAGLSPADPEPLGLLAGRPTVRAVVGGSGSYAGMRGTVTSTRRPDGSYTQAISLAPPAGSTRTVTVISTSGPGQQLDVPIVGNSPGDMTLVDDAVLRDDQDAIIGTVRGAQQVISTTGGRVVQAQLSYRLPQGELLVGGISRQVLDGTGLLVGTTFVRPVLGGTGEYAGAGGTMTTMLDASGRYQQRFDLSGIGAPVTRTVRVVADDRAARIERIDQPQPGVSAGDQTAYSGPLRNARGKRRVGTARGLQTTVTVENGRQTVASQLTYALRGHGTLIVGGLSQYPASGTSGTVRGALPDRPVIGGTGDFAGAHGVLRTARRGDGSYRLTFSLSGAPSRKR